MNRKVLFAGALLALPLVGILFASLGRDAHTVESPLVGRAAPAFTLIPAGGGPPISLAALRGKPVVVNFWATWCVPCFQEHPVLTQAARTLGGDVQFVGVVYDDEEPRVLEFLKRQGQSYPSLLDPDGKTAIAYGVYGVPETFFVDAQGNIVSKFVGPLHPEALSNLLAKARGGR